MDSQAHPSRDGLEKDTAHFSGDRQVTLAVALEHLPVAVGLFDQSGKFVIRSGALRALLGDVIAPRDPEAWRRWQVFDADGRELSPPEWPSARALCGQAMMGVTSIYRCDNGEQRWLQGCAVPFSDGMGFSGGVAFLQDIDEEKRGQAQLRESLETRFVEALVGAIRTVCRDMSLFEPEAARAFVDRTMGLPPQNSTPRCNGLSEREAEVLKRIAWGKSFKLIANELGISVKTVDYHRSGAVRKLRLRNRTDIVRYAIEQDWFRETP
jgi:DNA-binding CsgD family transcriptional regulator/PAS domain-containing protein